jgi:hypothetical protein
VMLVGSSVYRSLCSLRNTSLTCIKDILLAVA